MKKKIGFIAVGQAGGNIGKILEQKGFVVLYLNTSQEDLNTLKDVKFTYHIKGGEGSNRDRTKAKQLIIQDFEAIEQQIIEKIGVEFLFVIFSAGGGTGSGAGPMLMELLLGSREQTVGAITILPAATESVRANMNAYECFTELTEIEGSAAIFVLDNNKGKILEINQRFVNDFLSFLQIPEKDKSIRGNIDRAEILETLHAHGMAYITSTSRKDTAAIIGTWKNNIYAPMEQDKVIKYISLSAYGVVRTEEFQKELGIPLDIYQTYNEERSICALSGLSYPKTRLDEIYQITMSQAETVSRNLSATLSSKMHQDINFLKQAEKGMIAKPVEKKVSKHDIMKKYL